MRRRTGIVMDPWYLEHRTIGGHPESPRRLEAVYSLFDEPETKARFHFVPSKAVDKDALARIHSPEHIHRMARTADCELSMLTPDTPASAGSYRAALLAAGGFMETVSRVASGMLDNAMALVRPPGHHAERNRAMGFCLFNTIAIGAAFARMELGMERILIVDWDVHHGNGTQHAFEADPAYLYFSIHQYPLFPGTGLFQETGVGKGEGFTMNLPLPSGYSDGDYAVIFDKLLRLVALEFQPQIILVSAGFDTHFADPLGGMRMTSAGYAALTRILMEIADTCCNGRIAMVLEGGYHLGALKESVRAVLRELNEETASDPVSMAQEADPKRLGYAFSRCIHAHRPFWKCLEAL
ncbi:MAG: histone deacetylase [Deltaproteobacteria bacterium]|nr:histone deacetylase [Deltaproteobacteria bacterium]